MNSPLAGAWLFFHLAGCAALIYNNKYPTSKGLVWYACLLWLLALGAGTFLLRPIPGGGATMFVLAIAPSLALCLRKENLTAYLWGFGGVIVLYGLGLLLQEALDVRYSAYNPDGRRAWPLLDPNNAACVLNFVLIPSVYLAITKDRRWWGMAIVMASAMYITGSKAGLVAGGTAVFILFVHTYGIRWLITALSFVLAVVAGVIHYDPAQIMKIEIMLLDRWVIWQSAWQLIYVSPWRGLGLGMFGYYYKQVRTEIETGGWFAHNDILQLSIELGIPATLFLIWLLAAVAVSTWRGNIVAACVTLMVLMQASIEFQFYVPAVSMPLGLVLGYHMLNRRPGMLKR